MSLMSQNNNNYYYFNLNWHVMSQLKRKKKLLITLIFSIQHLLAKTILSQVWKVTDQFDIVERLGTNLTQGLKVEDRMRN